MLQQILGGSFEVARTALSGLSRRQSAISANVANIDTPGYHRKAVDFEDALKESLAITPASMQTSDPRHFTKVGARDVGVGSSGEVRDVISERNDGNDVSIDEEMLLLVDTQLRYQALSQATGTRIGTLRTIIRGG
ncbi:MAG: flagellar basal body rod protein FlgB [Dehalococcoidia bacterium]|nr:flagellar basal body rod protein FlgB [Dehalococcoidia bacterium]MCA9851772.1 flagellar basal body rod protein FlgB [Dehalococcoidia bacterium]MCA9857550.1 flagellar basal body rod protein FlgB [Dehalococcoidia bacterium]MCB9483264.1 flagellar basal body rod protein FlgB [Dehalococcoidia bacterium]MCB9492309.1 flagellar basal body rod protein FlgB [Dehalococcoidia bacterium]